MNPSATELINFFIAQKSAGSKNDSAAYLHTHETIGRLARFYESLRNAVDLKEEHLLRRNATERILKRLIILENMSRKNMGKELLVELIRAGYLSNDALPESRVPEFEKIINRYIRIICGIEEPAPLKTKLQNWLISVASVEIEEKLNAAQLAQENIITRLAFNELFPNIKIKGVSELEIKTHLFIAVLKTILKADESLLRLRLLEAHCQGFEIDDPSAVSYLTKNLAGISSVIDKEIKNKLNTKLSCSIKKFAPVFWIFSDFLKETAILEESADNIPLKIQSEGHLNKVAGRICDRRYFEAKMRLWRTTKKSIIFLLFTKTFLAFILELPYGLYILKDIKYTALFVNVIFHPLLLGVIASTIKIPGKENTAQIIKGIKEILNPQLPKEVFKPQIIIRRGKFANLILNFIYTLISLAIFVLLTYGLYKLNFNHISIALFCFFLSLVSFLGWRSRQSIQEMFVVPQAEKLPSLLLDFFALPIISLGQWLTKKLPKFNIFTIIMDFLIEAPFQTIVGGLESWARFTKEKREEIEI